MADHRNRLALPSALAVLGFSRRAETQDDLPFLERLYVSVRWEELAPTFWTDEAKLEFLASQFVFQVKHYTTHYPGIEQGILEHEGQPIGRLYLHRGRHDIRIVDISLLPAWRGQGIATALLKALFEEATETGRKVSIHVEQFNPAQRLYRRMGFIEAGENGPYWLMEWQPAAPLDSPSPSGDNTCPTP